VNASYVVYKRESHWFTGSVTDDKIKKKREIKRLADVRDRDEYLTLKQWLKAMKDNTPSEEILKNLKVESLYLKKDEPAPKIDEAGKELPKEAPSQKDWWTKKNEVCLTCVKVCKQSSHVIVVHCPLREVKK
jgi:hypothetical protein